MELRQLRYFVAVAEAKSITKAADRLNVAQPALSLSIKNLEDDLGGLLFTRNRRGVELTDTGVRFLDHAYRIIQQVTLAAEDIRDAGENPRGPVSIAMTASMANVLTVPIYRLVKERYPHIQLTLEEGLSGNMLRGFQAGWYDILLGFDVPATDQHHVEPLLIEHLYLVSKYNGAKPLPAEIAFAELEKHPLLVSRKQHSMGRTMDEYARQQNVSIRTVAGASALHPGIKLVEAGLVHGVLPWSAIHELVATKRLAAQKVVDPLLQREVEMIYPINRPRSPASLKVMDVIRQAVRQVHGEDKWRGQLLI